MEISSSGPAVALESTVMTHGLPQPQNVEIARAMCQAVRDGGADPRVVAMFHGEPRVGLLDSELAELAQAPAPRKCSLRDLPIAMARKEHGGCTVSATLYLSLQAGIPVFATGGIGGVHRGEEGDVSADLPALASLPGCVVCAGAKSILDLPRTRERLETDGVAVIGWKTDEFPAFYSRESGLPVDARVESAEELVNMLHHRDALGLKASLLLVCPCPEEEALAAAEVEQWIQEALAEAKQRGLRGKDITPFLLGSVAEKSGGRSLRANRSLLLNNARVAAGISRCFFASQA